MNRVDVSVMKGKTLVKVDQNDYEVYFETSDGCKYLMYHEQDCCESVILEDVCGDWKDLIGEVLLVSEEVDNLEDFVDNKNHYESYTWTFYRFSTVKGWVVLRWLGESNGYYSESVDFKEIKN